jgi:pantoate--beta-alanine ligase
MIIFKKAADLSGFIQQIRAEKKAIGFVPTMGALHQGHVSLIEASKKDNDLTVCSIFINPTQFNNPIDLEKYPVTLDADINKLEQSSCDVLFIPAKDEVYPPSYVSEKYDLGPLETVLEGKYRPGHFQGVCQVVDRLLQMVRPDTLYLGQKDYQQCMVIKKMIELKGFTCATILCDTVREKDGLAMSSRNLRLNPEERKQAVKISEALYFIKNGLQPGKMAGKIKEAHQQLNNNNFKIDYVALADANDLTLLEEWDGQTKIVVLVAAYLNEIRLIDNMVLN